MGRVAKNELLGFLEAFDGELDRDILLIAVGGTALTLLGIKASTKDVDFNIPSKEDYKEFVRVKDKIKPGVQIDCWSLNMVFTEILPEDYVKLASLYKSDFDKISVKVLAPIDIACSKISRFDDADMEDIKDCIEHYKIKKRQFKKRAEQYLQVGNEKIFAQNLDYVLKNMF